MAKDWWFKFEFNKWRNDSSLRRCSLEAKGFWLECICVMREIGSDRITGSYAEIARMIGCFPEEAARCIVELQRTETARVTLGNDCVTLVSRYISKELKVKKQTRLRVAKLRGNARVTHDVTNRVISKSKSNKKEEEKNTRSVCVIESFGSLCIEGIKTELNLLQIPKESDWLIALETAERNQFTVEHVLETFRLMRNQPWRTGPIKPDVLIENLPNLNKLREEKTNGTNRPTSEREKSASRTINANRMANDLISGNATIESIFGVDDESHIKGYLPS